MLNIGTTNTISYKIDLEDELKYMEKLAETAKKELLEKTGAGNDFLGWIVFAASLFPYFSIKSFLKTRKAIAGSVVVPDLLIILIEKSCYSLCSCS